MSGWSRRDTLAAAVAGLATVAVRPARAAIPRDAATEQAIRAFAGEAAIEPGLVSLDLPPLVENGNSAPLAIAVDGLPAGVTVKRIAVFNEKNPLPNVITVHLGAGAPPRLSTRIRLADSQTITAIAELSDGAYRSATADVIVTLAACVEGG